MATFIAAIEDDDGQTQWVDTTNRYDDPADAASMAFHALRSLGRVKPGWSIVITVLAQ